MAKSRILIVEDEVIVSKYIESCLTNLGYEITGIYTTGEEAVANVEDNNPNLILNGLVGYYRLLCLLGHLLYTHIGFLRYLSGILGITAILANVSRNLLYC